MKWKVFIYLFLSGCAQSTDLEREYFGAILNPTCIFVCEVRMTYSPMRNSYEEPYP